MSLQSQIKLELNEFHAERIRIIDDHDFGPMAKRASRELEELSPAEIEAGVENLKRFYVGILLDPLNPHAVSVPVDEFWHWHMLFSTSYVELSERVFGGYVHHVPLDPDDAPRAENVAQAYEYTRECHQKIFSHVDERWWPSVRSGSVNVSTVCHKRANPGSGPLKTNALFPVNHALRL